MLIAVNMYLWLPHFTLLLSKLVYIPNGMLLFLFAKRLKKFINERSYEWRREEKSLYISKRGYANCNA